MENPVSGERKGMFLTIVALIGLAAYGVFLFVNDFIFVYDNPVISFLLFLWFISTIGITQKQEWGRKLLIVTSVFISCYLMFNLISPVWATLSLVLVIVVLMMYYILPKTKTQFKNSSVNLIGLHKKILIVDDDKGLLKVVRAHLMGYGFEVITADSGEKGIQLAQRKRPNLIILDVLLPGIKGREVCARLKKDKNTRRMPVMFLTAKDSPDDVKAEMDAGAVTHLTKPVDPQELISEVKKVLDL